MPSAICPTCKHTGNVPAEHFSRQIGCRNCGNVFIPALAQGAFSQRSSPGRQRSFLPVILFGLLPIALLIGFMGGWFTRSALVNTPEILVVDQSGVQQPRQVAKAPEPENKKVENPAPVPVPKPVVPPKEQPSAVKPAPPQKDKIETKKPAPAPPKDLPPALKLVAQPFGPPLPPEWEQSFQRWHALVKPQPGEWKFAEVPWEPSLAEARVTAAKEGKPLFIWYMVGEPLGQC